MRYYFVMVCCAMALQVNAQTAIALPDPTGRQQTLASFKGKLVLVDFWASWCAPCRKTHPALKKLYAKYKRNGFEIFGVSVDEDKNAWRKAILQDGLPWTQVVEPGTDGPVATAWKISQVPTSFLLDRNGRIVARDLSPAALELKINQLLK